MGSIYCTATMLDSTKPIVMMIANVTNDEYRCRSTHPSTNKDCVLRVLVPPAGCFKIVLRL